jgi:hypothetical protein
VPPVFDGLVADFDWGAGYVLVFGLGGVCVVLGGLVPGAVGGGGGGGGGGGRRGVAMRARWFRSYIRVSAVLSVLTMSATARLDTPSTCQFR